MGHLENNRLVFGDIVCKCALAGLPLLFRVSSVRPGTVGRGYRDGMHASVCVSALEDRHVCVFPSTSLKCGAAESVVSIMHVSAQLCVFGRVCVLQVCHIFCPVFKYV